MSADMKKDHRSAKKHRRERVGKSQFPYKIHRVGKSLVRISEIEWR